MRKKLKIIGLLTLLTLFSSTCEINNCLSPILKFREHQIIHNPIKLNPEKRKELEKDFANYIQNNKITTPEEAIEYSLDFTAKNLTFRWDYFEGEKGTNYYKFPKGVKKADCRDYAFLFRETLKFVKNEANLEGLTADIMRSRKAFLFGKVVDNHDWVRVKYQGKTLNLDPLFEDYNLGGNIQTLIE